MNTILRTLAQPQVNARHPQRLQRAAALPLPDWLAQRDEARLARSMLARIVRDLDQRLEYPLTQACNDTAVEVRVLSWFTLRADHAAGTITLDPETFGRRATDFLLLPLRYLFGHQCCRQERSRGRSPNARKNPSVP